MTREELHDKALSLPYVPGVYLMSDRHGTVIYVGKAKKLKNRVSQYFQDSAAQTPKTRMMVAQIDSFDTIVARSEFEALVLECSLIKRHMPKYNILLKDDKGYPYLRLDLREAYPVLEMVNRVQDDGAEYFGPFGGRYVTQTVLDTIRLTLKLPGCHKQFPRDIGKDRPCLNFHMNNCDAWCQGSRTAEEYRQTIKQAVLLLRGNYQEAAKEIEANMLQAAEELRFEQAAALRDRLRAIESLSQRQLVTAGSMAHRDVVGFYQSEAKACFTVLHYVDGSLIDKDYQILPPADSPEEAVSSLVKQYYLAKQGRVKEILLPFAIEDAALFEQMLLDTQGRRIRLRVPQRGDGVRLVELANQNAREEAERVTSREERLQGALGQLQSMLGVVSLSRVEAYDISNLAGSDIVASMTVFADGKPLKKEYKRFKVHGLDDQDDYESMRQVIERRFLRLQNGDPGFDTPPDALLIDGGSVHAGIVARQLNAMSLSVPVFGMVKDHRHRTRALVTPEGHEIGLSASPAVFSLVGRIQEETHRFAITYNQALRSRRMRGSELDQIPGIGPKRRAELLKHFSSLAAIRAASVEALEAVVPAAAARAVYDHYHPQQAMTGCAEPPGVTANDRKEETQ